MIPKSTATVKNKRIWLKTYYPGTYAHIQLFILKKHIVDRVDGRHCRKIHSTIVEHELSKLRGAK